MAATVRLRKFTPADKPKSDAQETAAVWLRSARGILEQLAADARRLHEATRRKDHPLFGAFESGELRDAANSIEEASHSLLNADLRPPCPITMPDPVPGFDSDE